MLAFQKRNWRISQLSTGVLLFLCLMGCRATAPIYVWHPPQVNSPPAAKIALAPVVGDPEISRRIELAMLKQRPSASADLALFTAEQLVEISPIRLVSTAALNNDLTALHAARSAGADLLLQGQILATNISLKDLENVEALEAEKQHANMNDLFFRRLNLNADETPVHNILMSWRIIDVQSSRTLGSETFNLNSGPVALQYPDLAATENNAAALLIAASARQTWQTIAPFVRKEEVRLAVPWAQPGAWMVRRGVRAAKKGKWQQAEADWQKAADRYWFNASAHHNLSIAMAAREDFAAAKEEIVLARGVFNFRLPSETLFWLDQQHRNYHQAHSLAIPEQGWSFPDASEWAVPHQDATPINLADLPWWTAIPFVPVPSNRN